MIPSIQYCLISTGILPMLSLMAQPHSSWWMTPKQLATLKKKKKKKKAASEEEIVCPPSSNPTPQKQWKIANVKDFLMAWLDIFRLVPVPEGIYLVYPLKSNASIKRYDDKVGFNLGRGDLICRCCWNDIAFAWRDKQTAQSPKVAAAAASVGPQQYPKDRTIYHRNHHYPDLSTASFDLPVWLWGVLLPWIMVMCCSPVEAHHACQWACRSKGGEREGNERRGGTSCFVLFFKCCKWEANSDGTAVGSEQISRPKGTYLFLMRLPS